jgi:hypothetical protein
MGSEITLSGGTITVIATIVLTVFGAFIYLIQRHFEAQLNRKLEELRAELSIQIESIKATLGFSTAIDQDLRERRIPGYQELWTLTEILPLYAREKIPTYGDLKTFTTSLRNWYFRDGGIYLSETARDGYLSLQKSLKETLEGKRNEDQVSDHDYDTIRNNCSLLRTYLTEDILSRREAPKTSQEGRL